MAFVPFDLSDSIYGASVLYNEELERKRLAALNSNTTSVNDGNGGRDVGAGLGTQTASDNGSPEAGGKSLGYNASNIGFASVLSGLLSGNPIGVALGLAKGITANEADAESANQATIDNGGTVAYGGGYLNGGVSVSGPSGFSAIAAGYSAAQDSNNSNSDSDGSDAGGYSGTDAGGYDSGQSQF
jgi:hypothetical protein